MGNDVSLQKSVVIDEKKATEVTFFWVQGIVYYLKIARIISKVRAFLYLHTYFDFYAASATYKNGTNTSRLSLFKGDTNSEESFWKRANPLEKAGKV